MKKFLHLLISIWLVFLGINLSVLAQTKEKETLRIVDFGASLKPGFTKKTPAKKEAGSTNDEVIRVQTELVVNDIRVLDKQGNEVKGLGKEDFIIKEDGALQEVETFSLGDGGTLPRSIVLIIDYSGSQLPYIKTSVAAAKTLVDKLKPRDRVALVTDDVELLTGFTHDKYLLKEKLDSLEKKAFSKQLGRSKQYSALMATLNELFSEEDVRPIVIFQTDGDEYGLLKGNFRPLPPPPPGFPVLEDLKERNFSYKDILTAAEKARTTVYTIIPGYRFIGLSEKEQMEQARKSRESSLKTRSEVFNRPVSSDVSKDKMESFLQTTIRMNLHMQLPIASLAKFTGGWADYLETPEQADGVYSRVLADINSRYLIGYYPTNQVHDGKRRVVKIEVRNHSDYKVWGRTAYFSPEPK